MKTAFTLAGMLFGFLLFLCVTVNGKPIFNHIYGVISPVTIAAQNATQDFFGKSFSSTQAYSKKLFDNSVPKLKDSVKSKQAAIKQVAEPAEKITDQEKEQLDDLIKNH